MKTRGLIYGLAATGCAIGVALPPQATAQVSEEDFKALKEGVQKLNDKVQKLSSKRTWLMNRCTRKTWSNSGESASRKKLGETQKSVAATQQSTVEAEQKEAAAGQVQPLPRVPIDEATVNHNFLCLGDAEIQYDKAAGQHGTFLLADFAPIFLYRGGDNILFEAGFDFILQNNSPNSPGNTTTVNHEFCPKLNYVMNDYMTFAAGDMLLPLGTYSQRAAGWLNKFPDDPLPRELVPGSGVGAELLGSVALGESGKTFTYSVYGVNGPSSADGTGNAGALDLGGNVGLRSDNTVANLHGSPTGGGRLAVFMPFKPHYDFELGISGQSGQWDNAGDHVWTAGVIDASLHLGPCVEVKGEYVKSRYGSDDFGLVRPQGWWVQAGYKLAGLNLELPGINNLELVGRYDTSQDGLGIKTDRVQRGLCLLHHQHAAFRGRL